MDPLSASRHTRGPGKKKRPRILFQWLFLVPLKGGIGSIWDPPEGKDYKWYILPIGGLYATYHLLGEPETTIDLLVSWNATTHDGNVSHFLFKR